MTALGCAGLGSGREQQAARTFPRSSPACLADRSPGPTSKPAGRGRVQGDRGRRVAGPLRKGRNRRHVSSAASRKHAKRYRSGMHANTCSSWGCGHDRDQRDDLSGNARAWILRRDEIFVGHSRRHRRRDRLPRRQRSGIEGRFHELSTTTWRPARGSATRRETLFREDDAARRPEVHARAALAAQLSGKSMNQWGADVILAAAKAATADESDARHPGHPSAGWLRKAETGFARAPLGGTVE